MNAPAKPAKAGTGRRRGPSSLEIFCVVLLAGIAATWGYSKYAARRTAASDAKSGSDPSSAAEAASAHGARGSAPAAIEGDDIFAAAMRADAEAKSAGEARALERADTGVGAGRDPAGASAADRSVGSRGADDDAVGLKRTRKAGDAAAGRAGKAGAQDGGADGAGARTASGLSPAVEKLRAALASGESTAAIRSSDIEKFQAPDIQESLKMIESMPWGPEANRLFQDVIARWGKIEPSQAMDYAMSLDSHKTRNAAISSVLDSWAKADPQAAFSWYAKQAQESPGSVSWATAALFKNLAKADAASALVNTWRLEDAGLKRTALQSVVAQMTQSGQGDELVGLHSRMSAGADRNMLADLLVQSWTPYQPERAASWAMNLDDPTARTRTIDRVVSTWSADQPSKAADWVAGLPPGDMKAKELATVVQSWARDNVVEAADWLRRFPPSPETDPAVQNLSVAIAVNDPATAMAWAQNVTDPKARQTTMTRVAYRWMEKDPVAAQQYIVGSGLPAPTIQKLLGQPVQKIKVQPDRPQKIKTKTKAASG